MNRIFLFKVNSGIRYSYYVFRRMNSTFRSITSQEEYLVTIGDVTKSVKKPRHPAYVPVHSLPKDSSVQILSDLKWMLQKDLLGQDMFLIGRPGPWRRQLALTYSQLIQREIEFLTLSRDTTEADLKQRREIIDGSAIYINQSAVKAAIEGRILILEGVEKAERNVLPILNNLLENREMHLEDGRFLVASQFYDKLLSEHGYEYLSRSNFIRVHNDFRVIALGLPVPKYSGNSLDPPLRSRFQARVINPPSYQEMKNHLLSTYPNADKEKLLKLLSCGYALVAEESKTFQLIDFPIDHLEFAAKLLSLDREVELTDLFSMLYPFKALMTDDGCRAIRDLLKTFQINPRTQDYRIKDSWFGSSNQERYSLKVSESTRPKPESCTIYLSNGHTLETKSGKRMHQAGESKSLLGKYVPISYHDHQLVNFLRTHAADSDFCIAGPSGCGKSLLVQQLASVLGYDVDLITLYQDMTARDLIQRRETLANGDTIWCNSPLVDAALNGRMVVLDGIHRLHSSTLSFLFRLIRDRELQLHNGKRLMRHDSFDHLASKYGSEYLKQEEVLRIDPAFRIIAIGQSPIKGASTWLTAEILSFFPVHHLRALNSEEESYLLETVTGVKLNNYMKKVMNVVRTLRSSHDPTLLSVASSLSTRQLLRIAKKMVQFPSTSNHLYETIQQACLAKFLPPLAKQSLEEVLSENGIKPCVDVPTKAFSKLEFRITDDTVTFADSVFTRFPTDKNHIAKIPNVLFYDSPQHVQLLEELLQAYEIGQHLLLVGNQGVGKNKLTDRLLQLLNRPREYIQLHRDTTVQSLTMQPTIEKGSIKYEDSPLVKAVKCGHVLVIDEADKAPTHVTCILKTLVESGEMILSDDRRITCHNSKSHSKIIPMHPQFRMILIANRPGFPFLGNNLFAVLGDLFSSHVIDNPRPESEIQLLSKYAPSIDIKVIGKIVSAFGDLRKLADKGVVSYPFSTREAVSVVKHLEAFPTDNISEAAANVFDFDRFNDDMKDVLQQVFDRHNIPIRLADSFFQTDGFVEKNLKLTIERGNKSLDVSGPKHGKVDEKNTPHVGGNKWAGGTGGRDTAGLGGKGGPYRLDAGHDVHQLSDEEKQNVPEHVKQAAREMNRKAFERKLKEIKMSEYDANVYDEFSQPVRNHVQTLRVVLSNLESRSRERQWVRHQTSGELDDTKLVEGITGEKSVYRRRADIQAEPGAPRIKPKRLLLVVDVSGSMYRFNGYDGRLHREMEAVVMIMEAVQGHENKIKLEIVGHSGESENIDFLSSDIPVTNEKQRLQILKEMHAHSQFCMSGDNTLEAMRQAIKKMEKESNNYDENVVIMLSDANLSRYGIPPERFAQILISSKVVNAFVVFIGSLGNQAMILKEALPAGRGFVCMNLQELPLIIGQVFASSLLKPPE